VIVVCKELDQSDGFNITAYPTNKLSGFENGGCYGNSSSERDQYSNPFSRCSVISAGNVSVIAILHNTRNPQVWKNRIIK